ncbi:MAG: DotA/TraY family protein [Alphaproteobacteria bacterium]
MALTTGKIIKHTLLPGLFPRLKNFATSGFSHIAYYIALVYAMVGLIPQNHAYLAAENFEKFGIRHVIAQAANNLQYTRKNIDQIIMFFTVIAGLALIIMQFILLGISFLASEPALAFGLPINTLFANPNGLAGSPGPEQDIAFIILDRVFGMTGIFESCVSTGVPCKDSKGLPIPGTSPAFPFPVHEALHNMLQFYSLGMLFIGAWVLIYFIITIIGETATSGTPFGRRFNKGWVPIRVVAFFALLIPLNIGSTNEGMNGAQIITLYVAKHGSNFATNGWLHFNNALTVTYMGDQQSLIATPNIPELGSLNQFILTAKTCAITQGYNNDETIIPYIVRPTPPNYTATAPSGAPPNGTAPYLDALEFSTATFDTALKFSLNSNMTLRIGTAGKDTDGDGIIDEHMRYSGNIFPTCGEMVIPVNDIVEPGALLIGEAYFTILQEMWSDPDTTNVATCIADTRFNKTLNYNPACTPLPDISFAQAENEKYKQKIQDAVDAGVQEQKDNADFTNPTEIIEKGWGGAAIWYNRVAKMNGAVTGAILNLPRATKLPHVLEEAYKKRLAESATVSGISRYSLQVGEKNMLTLDNNMDLTHAAIYEAYTFWGEENLTATTQNTKTGNFFIDFINLALGTHGIFEMRDNPDIHPLAQLTSLGKGMIDSVIRNFGGALAGSAASGILGVLDELPAQLATIGSSFLFTLVYTGIGIAVILYYILPLLPFIYFFFAISGWIKSIFEAIVAMPLWALAHLRIDGDGLPGPAASNGYFLLLEIFLRPILILFGLLASISIFSALVYILNNIFDLVVSNAGGFDIQEATSVSLTSLEFLRAPVDEFFFTAVYAILCYLIGLGCFKLIDQIPNQILRWAGGSVKTFQEEAGDPAGKLTNNVYKGSLLISNQIKGATQGDLAIIATLS